MKKFLASLPLPLLRLAQILAAWMGLTFVVVMTMGVVVVLFSAPRPDSRSWLVLGAWGIPLGIALLWIAHALAQVIGDDISIENWGATWRRGLRAVIRPGPDDRLHRLTIRIPQPADVVIARLAQMPTPTSNVFLRRIGEPMARVNGEEIEVMVRAQTVWRGNYRADGETTLVVERVEKPGCQAILERVFLILFALILALFSALIGLSALTGASSKNNIFVAAVCCGLWGFLLWQIRISQFFQREHERCIEHFWREHFDAEIELTPLPRGLWGF